MSIVEHGLSQTRFRQQPHLPVFELAQWSLDKRTHSPESSQRLDPLFHGITELFIDNYAVNEVRGNDGKLEMRHPHVSFSTDDLFQKMFGDTPSEGKEKTLAVFVPGHKRTVSDAVMYAMPIIDACVKARLAGEEVLPMEFLFSGYPDNYGGGITNSGIEKVQREGFPYYGNALAEVIKNKLQQSDANPITRVTATGESQGTIIAAYASLALQDQGIAIEYIPSHVPGKESEDGHVTPGEQVQIMLGRYLEKGVKGVVKKIKGMPDQSTLTKAFIESVAPTLAEKGITNVPEERKYLGTLSWAEKNLLLMNPRPPKTPYRTSETVGIYDPLNFSMDKWVDYHIRRKRIIVDGDYQKTLTPTGHSPLSYDKTVVDSLVDTARLMPRSGIIVELPRRSQITGNIAEAAA